jgi:hypothetical protein
VTYLREPSLTEGPSTRLRAQSKALEFARRLLDHSADPLGSNEPELHGPLLALKRPGTLCDTAPSKVALEQLHRAAELTLAHLAPEPRRTLWIERQWLGCAPGKLAPAVLQRLELYAAIAARDAPFMLARARALLERRPEKGENDWSRFLLLTAMVGAHAAGNHDEARRLWRTYSSALYADGLIPPHVVYVANLQ